MSTVDQFESVFKAADKVVYLHKTLIFEKVLLVTDLGQSEAGLFLQTVRSYLGKVLKESETEWQVLGKEDFNSVRFH